MRKSLVAAGLAFVVAGVCSLAVAADRNADSFKKLDTNSDGKLTVEEFSKDAADEDAAKAEFKKLDKNSDSSLTQEEYTAK